MRTIEICSQMWGSSINKFMRLISKLLLDLYHTSYSTSFSDMTIHEVEAHSYPEVTLFQHEVVIHFKHLTYEPGRGNGVENLSDTTEYVIIHPNCRASYVPCFNFYSNFQNSFYQCLKRFFSLVYVLFRRKPKSK